MSEFATDVNVSDTDELVDYIFEESEEPGKVFVCRECGRDFHSEKKAPTLCPACRKRIASETGRIGGRVSKALQAAKKEQRKGSDAPPHPALRGHLPLKGEGSGPENGEPSPDTPLIVGTKGERAMREAEPAPEVMAGEKILRSAQDDTRVAQDDRTAEVRPATLTLGGLRRLLEGQGLDDAEITIDGQPVRSVFVTHYYDLQNGTENYRVDLG